MYCLTLIAQNIDYLVSETVINETPELFTRMLACRHKYSDFHSLFGYALELGGSPVQSTVKPIWRTIPLAHLITGGN